MKNVITVVLAAMLTMAMVPDIAAAHGNHNNPCSGPHKNDDGCGGSPPPPPPPPSTGLTYRASVEGGAFAFLPVRVTPNSGEIISLFPDEGESLDFTRPGAGAEQDAWDAVFNDCATMLGPTPVLVPEFTAPAGHWLFDKPGDRRVAFSNIALPADNPIGTIWLHFVGVEDADLLFIPRDASGTPVAGKVEMPLTRLWMGGRTIKHVKPKRNCHPKGTGVPDTVDLLPGAYGTIVVTACPVGTMHPDCLPE